MKKICAILGTTCILLFALFTITVKYDKTTSLDFDITVRVQDNTPQKIKPYIIKIGELGNWQITSIITGITMIMFRNNFWKIGITFAIITAIEIYAKYEILHPPPPQFMLIKFEHLNLPKYDIRDIGSYPSGHAARPAFLMMIWIPFLYEKLIKNIIKEQKKPIQKPQPTHTITKKYCIHNKKIANLLRILIFLGACSTITAWVDIIGFTKIYLGEHWTSDVIGGWLLGGGTGLITYTIINVKVKKLNIPEQKAQIHV